VMHPCKFKISGFYFLAS